MNHKKHSRSFSVFYRNSDILIIDINLFILIKNSFMRIHQPALHFYLEKLF